MVHPFGDFPILNARLLAMLVPSPASLPSALLWDVQSLLVVTCPWPKHRHMSHISSSLSLIEKRICSFIFPVSTTNHVFLSTAP